MERDSILRRRGSTETVKGGNAGRRLAALAVCLFSCFHACAGGFWVDERIEAQGTTGKWDCNFPYDSRTGRRRIVGRDVFTPDAPSSGDYVTMHLAGMFPVDERDVSPGADVQKAVGDLLVKAGNRVNAVADLDPDNEKAALAIKKVCGIIEDYKLVAAQSKGRKKDEGEPAE